MFSLPLVARFGGGLSGPIAPLTHVFYVDFATGVPLWNQTGNIETPFSTIAQAIVAVGAGAGTIVVVPGDYSAEAVINFGAGGAIDFFNLATCQTLGLTSQYINVPVTIAGIAATRHLNISGLTVTGAVSNVGHTTIVNDCELQSTVISGTTEVWGAYIKGNITASYLQLENCYVEPVAGGITFTAAVRMLVTNTAFLSLAGRPTHLNVAGTLKFDAFSAAEWHATAGSTLIVPGSFIDVIADTPAKMSQDLDGSGYALWHFENVKSAVDMALGLAGPIAFPAFAVNATRWGLVNGHVYTVTLRLSVIQWKDDKSAAGSVEFVEDALVTVAAGIVTLVFNRAPIPDTRGLAGSPLLAGTAGLSATAGGFTVTATRGAAVACHARWYGWFNRFDELLP